ncbi:hypothetical protein R6G69_01345 [Actinotignum urinale]|uniref:hypothetical protein n=1 Tax=Actinotignum urinale TaxID=190146 RepID=UPI002A826D11|nr:hypothetical protein [Actinotignum urinale]MDY5128643.1 hypothetical protein [Actinotignum urinale]
MPTKDSGIASGTTRNNWHDDIGLTDGWPEEARPYFGWNAWTRVLSFDHAVTDAPSGACSSFVCTELI